MTSRFVVALGLFLAVLSGRASAQEIEFGTDIRNRDTRILLEEDLNGQLTGSMLFVGAVDPTETPDQIQRKIFNFVAGFQIVTPFFPGVRGGVELLERLQAGVEVGLNPVFGEYMTGLYAQAAPLPGSFFKRIYFSGKIYRMIMPDSDGNDESAEEEKANPYDRREVARSLGLGFRGKRGASGSFWYVEVDHARVRQDVGAQAGQTFGRNVVTIGISQGFGGK